MYMHIQYKVLQDFVWKHEQVQLIEFDLVMVYLLIKHASFACAVCSLIFRWQAVVTARNLTVSPTLTFFAF